MCDLLTSSRALLTYVFDQNTSGVGVRTDAKAGTGAPGSWEASATAIDTLARVTQDQINAPPHVLAASGLALGADHVDVLVDGVPQGRAVHPGWADPVGAWSMNLNLAAGPHTLTVNAVHPSHQYTATASSTFTVAQNQGGNVTVTSAYDADGDVTGRTWDSGLAQTLTWDAFGRLIKVAQRDSANNGYDWSAVYDGLGRRLKTTQQTVTANVASGAATVTTSIYDPQVEFLEIGVAVNGVKAWKVYGPDLNGRFGGLQGTGGMEATILDADGTTTGVINDQFGNGVASVSGGSVTWYTTRVGAYGPLPGSSVEILTDINRVAEATAWRSRRIDSTGFIYLGARYYEPTSGRFLSADPLGHAASMSLYDYANGDPVNYFDPDGRLGKDPDKSDSEKEYNCDKLAEQLAANQKLLGSMKRDFSPGGVYAEYGSLLNNSEWLNVGQILIGAGADYRAARTAKLATNGIPGPLTMTRYPVGLARAWGATSKSIAYVGIGMTVWATVDAAADRKGYETANGALNIGAGVYAVTGPIGWLVGGAQGVIGLAQAAWTAEWNEYARKSTANAAANQQANIDRTKSRIEDIKNQMETLGCQ